ncbi:YxcD family protein [Paenibacillus aurantius]|uniref:YxcD family protein n=1 Tax=Paenibacillus aurantius TaxID=2918900 RepID=A0AA96L9H1_9BACL|nr:YxcD family protein [Paenibacillus aurantius]WNQ09198.1 YxcD family protein [Paenibacillus aurantius]
MRISEQEIMNAICLNIAERKQIRPTDVEVQLLWDEELGYSAEVTVQGRTQFLIEANMLEAIERYMLTEYNQRVFRSQIELDIDEKMFAEIRI